MRRRLFRVARGGLARAWFWHQGDDIWYPGGNGRLQGRIDRDQPVQPADIKDPPDNLVGHWEKRNADAIGTLDPEEWTPLMEARW